MVTTWQPLSRVNPRMSNKLWKGQTKAGSSQEDVEADVDVERTEV
jgi:hypothetical protein